MWLLKSAKKQTWTKNLVLLTAFAARLILIGYAYVHDYIFSVDFTDIDYHVFSDAANHVAEGRSPYDRATYRYTPFLAWILVLNKHIGSDFGKILFCLVDIAVGWMLFKMMEAEPAPSRKSEKKLRHSENLEDSEEAVVGKEDDDNTSIKFVSLFWLANPLIAVISARGNADTLVCGAVLLSLYLLDKKQWLLSALVHGILAVHLKIYPLIYLPSIFIHLSDYDKQKDAVERLLALITNIRGYSYALVSLLSLSIIVLVFYQFYGDVFLEEYLLYHVRRTDTRHNFSPYFLPLYLIGDEIKLAKLVGFGAFIPQVVSILFLAFRYHSDLPFCWFLTTFAFVTFNKVCTSQYFVWYIVFLPLICQRIQMKNKEPVYLIVSWFVGQGVWLLFAYLFEFQGFNVFTYIWLASLLFLLINCYIMRRIAQAYISIPAKLKHE